MQKGTIYCLTKFTKDLRSALHNRKNMIKIWIYTCGTDSVDKKNLVKVKRGFLLYSKNLLLMKRVERENNSKEV